MQKPIIEEIVFPQTPVISQADIELAEEIKNFQDTEEISRETARLVIECIKFLSHEYVLDLLADSDNRIPYNYLARVILTLEEQNLNIAEHKHIDEIIERLKARIFGSEDIDEEFNLIQKPGLISLRIGSSSPIPPLEIARITQWNRHFQTETSIAILDLTTSQYLYLLDDLDENFDQQIYTTRTSLTNEAVAYIFAPLQTTMLTVVRKDKETASEYSKLWGEIEAARIKDGQVIKPTLTIIHDSKR